RDWSSDVCSSDLGDDYRGAAVALDHACRSDADHAAVPAIPINHDAERVAKRGLLLETRFDLFQNSAFLFLALSVEFVEAHGKFTSARWVLHAEEFDDVAGHVHASSRIESRRDAECDFPRGQLACTAT